MGKGKKVILGEKVGRRITGIVEDNVCGTYGRVTVQTEAWH